MDRPKSNLGFIIMSLMYKFRDLRLPRRDILKEVGIEAGFSVLDYGCGPGSYIKPLAELVGESGMVYALDIHPIAIKKVKNIAQKKGIKNVETINSDCKTSLANGSMDVVLLYDIFHGLSNPNDILKEIHRVLKQNGILSFNDHHMKENNILSGITASGLFRLQKKGIRTYSFVPQELNTR